MTVTTVMTVMTVTTVMTVMTVTNNHTVTNTTNTHSPLRVLEHTTNTLSTALFAFLSHHSDSPDLPLAFAIIEYRVLFAPASFRQYAVDTSPSLLTLLCDFAATVPLVRLTHAQNTHDCIFTTMTVLRCLLITPTTLPESRGYTQFVQAFYEQYAQLLLPPILNRMPEAEQVLSLLGELRDQHGTNIQFLLLKNNLFPAILGFLTAPQRSLHLGNVSPIR